MIREKRTLATTIEEIKQIALPKEEAEKYFKNLRYIQQNNYTLIDEYCNAIEKEIRGISACLNWNIPETASRIEEHFHYGLSSDTNIEICRSNAKTRKEILTIIRNTEKVLLSNISNSEAIIKNKRHENKNISKWCKYHRNNNHNTEDCFTLKKRENKKEDKIHLIEDEDKKLLTLDASCNNIALKSLVDNGANRNFIKHEVVERCRFTIDDSSKNEVLLANETEMRSMGTCESMLYINAILYTQFEIKAKVVKELGHKIILGVPFLALNKVIIKYKNYILKLAGREIELPRIKNVNDNALLEKTKIFTLKESEAKEKIEDLVKETKRKPPILGLISNEYHNINLLSKDIISCPQYNIPLSLQKLVKEQIK